MTVKIYLMCNPIIFYIYNIQTIILFYYYKFHVI